SRRALPIGDKFAPAHTMSLGSSRVRASGETPRRTDAATPAQIFRRPRRARNCPLHFPMAARRCLFLATTNVLQTRCWQDSFCAAVSRYYGRTWDVYLTAPEELAIHRNYPKSPDRVRQVATKLLQLEKAAGR